MSATGSASIYVGDLADAVTEEILYQTFRGIGTILSVRLCREAVTGQSKNYGYVNFATAQDAQKAVDTLNHVAISGQAVRVMPSQRDAAARRSGIGNVFVKNLHQELVTNKVLHEHFSQFGAVLSAKVAMDSARRSRGYGFVQFVEPESAKRAIETLDATDLCGQLLSVAEFMPAKDRAVEPGKFFNIYVKNIGSLVDEEALKVAFTRFGPITSTVVMCNSQGKSRGFGFVNFRNSDDALQAAKDMDGHMHNGLRWKVNGARRREDGQAKTTQQHRLDRTILSIKNLSPEIEDGELRDAFEIFGPLDSIKIMKGPDELLKGSGIVQFKNPEDAEAAITGLNGQKIGEHTVPISVTLAPRRRAAQEAVQITVPLSVTVQGQSIQGTSPAYNVPSLQPVLAHPSVAYYPGPQLFYGHPVAIQQGQQQMPAAYLPLQAPTASHRHVYDQMGSVVAAPSPSPYLSQATPAQIGGLHAVGPMMRMGSSSLPYISYDSHSAGLTQYWHDPGGSLLSDPLGQDPQMRGQRIRGYLQRPQSPLQQATTPSSSATMWRRFGTQPLPSLDRHTVPASRLSQRTLQRSSLRDDLPAQPGGMLSPASAGGQHALSSLPHGDVAEVTQSELLARTAGLFTAEATAHLFREGSLQTIPPSTTSGFSQ